MKKPVQKPVKWVSDNLVFPPVISSPLIAGHKVGKHIIGFQKSVLRDTLEKRKNIFLGWSRQISKSSLLCWIILFLMHNKEVAGVTMGPTFSQSGVVFRALKKHIEFSPLLNGKFKIRDSWIEHKKTGSLCRRVYNSPSSNIGQMSIDYLLADELCRYDRIGQENILTILAGLSMGGKSPLLMFASNPPPDPTHWSLDYLKKLRGDPAWKFYEFSAPEKSDPWTDKAWAEANPFIKHYLKTGDKKLKWTYQFYQNQARIAKENKTLEISFRTQNLGQRVAAEAGRFCEVDRIGYCDDKIFGSDGSIRWSLGIDLSYRADYTAFALIGQCKTTEQVFLKPFLFLANTHNRRESQKLEFQNWHNAGHIKIWNLEVIPSEDSIKIVKDFIEKKSLRIEKVVADPALSKQWDLKSHWPDNLELVYNSPRKMTGAIRYLEKIIHEKKLALIGDNPAALSHFNSALVSAKSKDYCSLDRASTWQSIDLVVASTLAIKHLSENKPKEFKPFFISAEGKINDFS